MGYYVSNMIGIRTGGVFSNDVDMEDVKTRIRKLINEMKGTEFSPDIHDSLSCLSNELHAHKGSYIMIAGVFNYWRFELSSEFARRLSSEFGTEVMIMCWDEEQNTVQTQIYLAGNPLFEVSENPVGQILRRIG